MERFSDFGDNAKAQSCKDAEKGMKEGHLTSKVDRRWTDWRRWGRTRISRRGTNWTKRGRRSQRVEQSDTAWSLEFRLQPLRAAATWSARAFAHCSRSAGLWPAYQLTTVAHGCYFPAVLLEWTPKVGRKPANRRIPRGFRPKALGCESASCPQGTRHQTASNRNAVATFW